MNKRKNKLIFHLIVVAFFVVAWRGIFDCVKVLGRTQSVESRLATRFLTNWNFLFQTVLFVGYFLYDIAELIGLRGRFVEKMKRMLDLNFYTINAPTSIFVAGIFWGVSIHDKLSLGIFPAGLLRQRLVPDWVNHSTHTIIVVNVLLQAYLNKVSFINVKKALISHAAFYLLYLICIYGTYWQTKIWVYPFFGKLIEPCRISFLLILFLCSCMVNVIFLSANGWYCNTRESKPLKPPVPLKPRRQEHGKRK